MKKIKTTGLMVATALFLFSCNGQPGQTESANTLAPTAGESFIPVDSANKMISSFLGSVTGEDSSLHSMIMNAVDIRDYLKDTTITELKIMFAHKLSYINSGHQNVPAGYNLDALTVVLAGFDSSGNYVVRPGSMVPNRAAPCPVFCPNRGTAANDLIIP